MKNKKLLILLVVVAFCCLASVFAIIIAFMTANQINKDMTINDLREQLNVTANSTVNSTNTTNTTNTTQTTPAEAEKWTVSSNTDLVQGMNYNIDIVYPVLQNDDHPVTAAHVNSYILAAVTAGKNETLAVEPSTATAKPSLSLDYKVEYLSDNLVSIVISGSQYLGGAHPGSVHYVVNYDLKNDSALTLTDVFNSGSTYLAEFSSNYRVALATKMGVSSSDSQLVGGTSPDEENFQLFYFSGNETVTKFGMIFGDYQVAPYAAGPQTVELDVEHVSGLFTSEFTALL